MGIISLRFTDDEELKIRELASRKSTRPSTYLKKIILDFLDKPQPVNNNFEKHVNRCIQENRDLNALQNILSKRMLAQIIGARKDIIISTIENARSPKRSRELQRLYNTTIKNLEEQEKKLADEN